MHVAFSVGFLHFIGCHKKNAQDPKSLSNLWTFLEPLWFPFQDLEKWIGENPRIFLVFSRQFVQKLFAPLLFLVVAQGASRRCSKKGIPMFLWLQSILNHTNELGHTGTHTIFSMHGGLLAKKRVLDCWIVGFFWMKDNAFSVKTNSWFCFKNKLKNYPVRFGLFHVSH